MFESLNANVSEGTMIKRLRARFVLHKLPGPPFAENASSFRVGPFGLRRSKEKFSGFGASPGRTMNRRTRLGQEKLIPLSSQQLEAGHWSDQLLILSNDFHDTRNIDRPAFLYRSCILRILLAEDDPKMVIEGAKETGVSMNESSAALDCNDSGPWR
jgi:hypothetical protein